MASARLTLSGESSMQKKLLVAAMVTFVNVPFLVVEGLTAATLQLVN